ncbi:hypothetical protein E4U53_001237 [Claviceps sorghi]|nr:hypothetical protein E4U53_001237 [Claviceps sorghi]
MPHFQTLRSQPLQILYRVNVKLRRSSQQTTVPRLKRKRVGALAGGLTLRLLDRLTYAYDVLSALQFFKKFQKVLGLPFFRRGESEDQDMDMFACPDTVTTVSGAVSLVCNESLPSYREATEAVDWVQLISPYCRLSDYFALCLVNRHFSTVFLPLLWKDLLRSARLSGLDPGDDLKWWLDFVDRKLDHLSAPCRALIRILDARYFGKNAYESWSHQREGTLDKAFERALTVLPNVNAILLDGHRDLHLDFLAARHESGRFNSLRVLSIAECRHQVPRLFFAAPSLQNLVYLDMSYLPGSLLPLVQPTVLPGLRILKVKGRELHDAQCLELIRHFRRQLWSLDISENNITDSAIRPIRDWCIPTGPVCRQANSFVEGRLLSGHGGTEYYGPFVSIKDGELSGSFSHAERYYADAPRYPAQSPLEEHDHDQPGSDGSTLVRQDTAKAATAVFTGSGGQDRGEEYQQSMGLTHLRLSHNTLSAVGIQKLLHISNGHIEDLTCDSMPLLPRIGHDVPFWPSHASLRGILGAAHCFRPAMSRKLRVLRLHHSVVTNIPSLLVHGATYKARCLQAETVIRERIETMFPQTFLPDMNPRIYSLTLTCLPRFSSGPLISKLIQFLQLLSTQEGAIQDVARNMPTRHSPKVLSGLRHLRLEFDSNDIMDDDFSASLSQDAEHGEDEIFSFFPTEQVKADQVPAEKSASSADVVLPPEESGGEMGKPSTTGAPWLANRDESDFVTHDGHWHGEAFSVQVWIGPAHDDAPEALRDYRRMVVDHGVRDGVGPVTPAQIQAGAPQDSFIYQIAWSAAVMPATLRTPRRAELAGMRDVLDALKTYRLESRAKHRQMRQLSQAQRRGPVLLGDPHFFWTGLLQVSTEVDLPVCNRAPA